MKFADEGKPQPAGTQFLGLVDSLIDLFKEPGVENVEVIFVNYTLDEKGERVVEDNQHVVEFHAMHIRGIGPEVQAELKKSYAKDLLVSLLVLWQPPAKPGKLGTLKFHPVVPGKPIEAGRFEMWEQEVIAGYMQRHNLDSGRS
jgi:hypothetical protein